MMFDKIYAKCCRTSFELPTEKQLVSFENDYHLNLPASYRNFILTRNGGSFRGLVIEFGDNKSDFLTYMHGLNATFAGAELGEDINLFDDNEPPVILPIGGTGFGSLVLLVVGEGADNGNVLIKHPNDESFEYLAETLPVFFAALTFDDN